MYAREHSLGEKLHTYGLSYLEVFRVWFLGGLFVTFVAALSTPSNPMIALGAMLLCIIGFFVHLVVLESNPKRIIVYEYGVAYLQNREERSWRWEQITDVTGTRHTFRVNGIPILRYGENKFHAGAELAFAVSYRTAEASRLVELIFMKMAECKLPRLKEQYQSGTRINFGAIYVDRNGIGNAKQQLSWADVAAFRLKGDTFRIKRYGEPREIKLGRVQPPSSYLLLGLLDRILDTRVFSEYQRLHIRGPVRWLGIPRTAVLATLLIVGIFAFIFGAAVISDSYNQSQYQAERDDLIRRFGSDINTMCAASAEHPNGAPSGSATRYIVVNADRDTIFTAFQNALDQSKVATSRQDLTTIICLSAKSVEVERCDYGDKDNNTTADFHISRIQKGYRIALIDIVTGKTIASGTIPGPVPAECPDTIKRSADDIVGPLPEADQLNKWLHDLNAPPSSQA